MPLVDWQNIHDQFSDGLILGNGTSIAIDERFTYTSLLEHAENSHLLSESVTRIFEHLETRDFELVLKMLWHTHRINQALDVQEPHTSAAYQGIRNALIQTVRGIHAPYADVVGKLESFSEFLRPFETVASLNYDLLVYWSMLWSNEHTNQQWFKDCFIGGRFRDDWEALREPYGDAEGSTLVFYPHGNLSLVCDLAGAESKVMTNNAGQLLEAIIHRWESGNFTPLIVSEGTYEQKRKAIDRSSYLRTVFHDVFTDMGSAITIFGWSLSEQDSHILDALHRGDVERVAIGLRVSPDTEARCVVLRQRVHQFLGFDTEVVFFNSESAGDWAR